jgi:Protein of unknown function (DUF998)
MRPVGHVSLALLGTAVACVVALHMVRPRISPIERRLSEYALGPYGWLMDIAFAATASGLTALAIFLARAPGRPRLVPAALVVAAVALVVSAVFRLDATDAADDLIHRWASGTAAAAVVVAAVGWSVVGTGRRRPWRRGPDRLLAILAVGLAVLGPLLHETFVTGINQRLVWAALIAWSVVVTIGELNALRGGAGPVRRPGGSRCTHVPRRRPPAGTPGR